MGNVWPEYNPFGIYYDITLIGHANQISKWENISYDNGNETKNDLDHVLFIQYV